MAATNGSFHTAAGGAAPFGARIAKPLRGGGGGGGGAGVSTNGGVPVMPTLAGLQAQESRRASWLKGWPSPTTNWT